MKKQNKLSSDIALLRKKAEEKLKQRPAKTPLQLYEADDLRLIHELEVHQIELEMQNEELMLAKEREAELAKEKYIELYDFAPSGYFTLARDGEIIDLNLRGAAMLGGERAHLKNISFSFFVSEDTKPAFRLFLSNVFASNTTTSCEVFLLAQGKVPLCVFITGKAIPDMEQSLITVVDITERKNAEKALKEENLRFELAMQAANMAWWDMDLTTGQVTFGKRKAVMLGYPPEKFEHYADFMALVHPDDYEKVMNAMLMHINGESGKYEVEYRILTQSGKYKWFYDIGSVIKRDSKGKPLSAAGLVIDITSRKQAEENFKVSLTKYRVLFDSFPLGVTISDIDGNIVECNQKAIELLGLSRENQIKQQIKDSNWNIVSADGTPFPEEEYASVKALKENRLVENVEMGIVKDENDITWLNVTAAPIPIENYGVAITYYDISQRKKVEQDLIKAKERAEESDRLKSAFLANISHEIRTPMNGIIGFAELLKTPDLTGEQQLEYIRIIKKSSDRMLNTINNIVDISKIESGQMKVSLAETNINEQMEYICNLFKSEVESKNIQFSFKNGLPGKSALIKTDRQKIFAILSSLLRNAIKYTEKGAIEFGYDKIIDTLQFYVKDTGIGIPADRQQAVFERFIQADIVDIKAFQGAGLGLSISKAYIELLGGKIWVKSEPGKGSSFYFTIPYDTVSFTETSFSNALPAEDASGKIKKLKILIADDDEISELLISSTFKQYSKEILKVHTGDDAVKICRNQPDINLVMMDIKMPGIDGYEATRQIRQFNKKMVIVAQTAFGLTGDSEKAKEAGCDDYISKPLNLDLLKMLIQKHFYD